MAIIQLKITIFQLIRGCQFHREAELDLRSGICQENHLYHSKAVIGDINKLPSCNWVVHLIAI
jgi:hypothetical protein